MISINNSLIRSCIEYSVLVFYYSLLSAIWILETSYNTAIRLATGLLVWRPLLVLHRGTCIVQYGQLSQLTLQAFTAPPPLHSSWFSSQQGGLLSAVLSCSSVRNRNVSRHYTSTHSPISMASFSGLHNAFNNYSRFSISRYYSQKQKFSNTWDFSLPIFIFSYLL